MRSSISIPSVFEHNNSNLSMVSQDLINGLRLYIDDVPYVVGKLALSEGLSPHRTVNAAPTEIDYQILFQAALLAASHKNNRPLTVTTGFPFSTYQVNKSVTLDLLQKTHKINFDMSPFSSKGRTEMRVEVTNVDILPEMLGNIIALRQGDKKATGNFFVISLGYGTCEAALSTENGIVQRTAVSINGLQYAVKLFMNELSRQYSLGLRNEKQMEQAFMNDFIVLNRQKIDILDIRRNVLNMYYRDVISPELRRIFTDADFAKADKMFITGGGALYMELVENFFKEFEDVIHVEVVDNPLTLTSVGYCIHSAQMNGGDESSAVGIDIGNSSTVITQYVDTPENQAPNFKFK